MPWRRRRTAPHGMPRHSSPRPLHLPKPPAPGPRSLRPRSTIQTQAPARSADDDRYSSLPPFFGLGAVLQPRSVLSSTRCGRVKHARDAASAKVVAEFGDSRECDPAARCASQGLHLALCPEFAQLEFMNLARPCQRKSLDREPVPRGLVRGERGAHVGGQFFLVDDGPRRGTNEGGDLFAPFFVR